eukprot:CAMPEP_0202969438 /NCGR_PEP_ID=MMETSP1396-20130829/15167_1 /ASSEMBLY_ACC=CAM_ASM_000872 /TAXON_ID= /ORGANISM="Pseudokeronopsis sp., Strain Brazil" /LENGTH=117 /DNA_ID=CAMNT_0049696977 /DNA_START=724 /DNA_END=1077 /DNA_ORIENTATION=+
MTAQKVNMYLQNNSIELNDDPWEVQKPQSKQLHSFANYFSWQNPNTRDVMQVFLRYDSAYTSYSRDVRSVLGWLGSVGGLQQVLILAGMVIVNFVTAHLLGASIMRRLYLQENGNVE